MRISDWSSDVCSSDLRYSAALHVLSVPATHPALAFVLTAVTGHLFGYAAALAIDAPAMPLREARAAIEDAIGAGVVTDGDELRRSRRPPPTPAANSFLDRLRSGAYAGHLRPRSAVRLAPP